MTAAIAESIVDGARTLAGDLVARAHEIETLGRIPDDIAAALAAARLFAITTPRSMGGLGLPPSTMWRATFEIGRACASSAWLVGLNGANLLMVGKFPRRAQEEVFLGGRPPIVPLLTGGVGRNVSVVREPGGLRLSGTWHYASGIDVATWVGLLVPVPDGDGDDRPVDCVVLVEQQAFRIDHASWTTVGMRGTGSKTVHLDGAFVPDYRRMAWEDLQAGRVAPDCPNDEPLYRLPLTGVFAMSVLAPTLGVASGIVDEFRAVVAARLRSGTGERQQDDRATQIRVSETETWMDMLRGQLVADADWLLARVAAGKPLGLPERAALRARIALCSRQALGVCHTVFGAVGGSILPAPSRLERGLRDIHGMTSHFLLQPDQIGEINGRALLGLDLPASARL